MTPLKRFKKKVRALVSRHPGLDRFVRLHYFRNYRARRTGYPDWNAVLGTERARWDSARRAASGPKVLLATSIGAYLPGMTVESVLGAALTLRGARVHALLCDAALPACHDCTAAWYPDQEEFVKEGPADLCRSCFAPGARVYETLGFPVHKYSAYLRPEDVAEAERVSVEIDPAKVAGFRDGGIAVGEHALAGTLRFFARASLEAEPNGAAVLRRYLAAALLTARAAARLFDAEHFDAAVFHHGIYVPQGLLGEVARLKGVRVVNWNPSYRKKTFIFSHGETYHHTLLSEPTDRWENLQWTPELDAELDVYLKSRWHGSEDWIWFHESPRFDPQALFAETGLDPAKPCIGLLTNVMWDAQLHYPANAFPNMLDWVLRTIEYFRSRPDLQLLIRIHPAEIRGTVVSRQPLLAEIRRAFPELPKNVFVLPPESPVSTYAAMSRCDAALIYGTKTGVELVSAGIPVIVAGEAWIRNKGITHDAATPEEYFGLLRRLPFGERLDEKRVERARKYAYHFFFRRMIPLEFMETVVSDSPFRLGDARLSTFEPGASAGLDVLCDGILKGSDFIYPAERLRLREAEPAGRA